jgi:hypothetical protein
LIFGIDRWSHSNNHGNGIVTELSLPYPTRSRRRQQQQQQQQLQQLMGSHRHDDNGGVATADAIASTAGREFPLMEGAVGNAGLSLSSTLLFHCDNVPNATNTTLLTVSCHAVWTGRNYSTTVSGYRMGQGLVQARISPLNPSPAVFPPLPRPR